MIAMVRLAILVAVCGCDAVFGLHHGDIPPAGDAPADIATVDAGPCPAHPHAVYVAPGDLDGDGEDNCHDPCPLDGKVTSTSEGLTDTDGDGIPDICDPDAGGGGTAFPDCVLLLDQFDDNNHPNPLDARWTSTSSSGLPWEWKSCGGSQTLAYCSPSGATTSILYFDQALPGVSLVIAKGAAYNITSTFGLFEIFGDAARDAGDLDGRACEFFTRSGPQTGVQISDYVAGLPTAVDQNVEGGAYADGTPIEVSFEPLMSSTCKETQSFNIATSSPTTPPSQAQRVGLGTENEDFELRSFVAFGASAACR